MPKYGYSAYTFQVRPYGSKRDPLPLGELGSGRDGLVVLYGVFRGLMDRDVKVGDRHLRVESAIGQGRTVRFTVGLGNSGQTSSIIDPTNDDQVVFNRAAYHIEASPLRGLLLAPKNSKTGILALEVQGRSSARSILCPALKRGLRHHTGLILDFAAIADKAALEQYLNRAAIKAITLHRSGLPTDIADVVGLARNDVNVGDLELRIKPGGVRAFSRSLIEKLRGDNNARHSLLTVGNLDFSELSITLEVGARQKTLTVDAERVPSFVYNLPGGVAPSDDTFYKEALSSIDEIAQAVGVTVGTRWQDGSWSPAAAATKIELPVEESDDKQHGTEASQ